MGDADLSSLPFVIQYDDAEQRNGGFGPKQKSFLLEVQSFRSPTRKKKNWFPLVEKPSDNNLSLTSRPHGILDGGSHGAGANAGHCGDHMQLGKGKCIPSSEPMGSEEIKCAKGNHPPVRCNSTKAGFCITKTGTPMDNILTDLPGGVKILAPEFERSFICARVKEEVNPEQLVVGNSTDVEQPLGQGQGIEHDDAKKIASLGSELAVREENDRFLKESASKPASLICNQAKLHSFPEEDSTKNISHNLNMNSKERRKYIVIEDDMKELSGRDYLRVTPKFESRTNSDDLDAVTSRPAKESSSNSLPDLKEPILIKNNKGACLEACLDNFGGTSAEEDDNNDILNTGKYKGTKVKQENESHESVEGSDNVQSVSTGKRKCSFTDGMTSSKIQKLSDGTTPCSETFLKKGSSFMKWISNLKGLSEFNLDRKFLSENSQRPLNDDNINLDSLCMLEETDQDAGMCRNRSFRNFFHAMYCKDLSLHVENFENSKCVMGAKESWKVGKTRTRPSGEGCSYAASGKNNELPYQPKRSKVDERSGSRIGGNSPSLLTLPSLGNTIAVSKEKYKDNTGGNRRSYNIACGFEKTGINLPRASSVKGSGSSTDVMGQPMPDGIEGGKPSEITNNKKVIDRNLWIARLSPSCSARSFKPLNDSKGVDCANEALALVDGGVSSIPNSVDATMKPKMLEASQPPSRRSMDGCVSPMDMHYSKRNEIFELEKLPSQRFILPFPRSANISDSPANDEEIPNNPYMFSSRNVKGLDIHKQTITASTARETNTLLCFFCGCVGHSIRKCSEIAKCKLEYPLTNIIACDSDEEYSHFCIHCFQLDHWAISCPLLSSPVDRMGLERLSCEKAGAPLDHDRKHSTQSKAIGNDYWFNKQKARVVDNDQAAVDNPRLERSQSAPSSGCLESKLNQIIPFFGPHTGNISSLPHAMFERIRRLQLSRSDIVRWMKVPQLNLHLKGFFLRVCFRKWEERLGGGHCVACISGVIQEREHGRNKIQLLVNLGGSNCLVDYGYVSNHEFTEEELMEWWFSTLSGDAYVPSEEDFRLKIEEKKKLNISCPE